MKREYGTRNVFLVGLMGAGKTTIGKSLARHMALVFIDSDREIEARTGVSIPTVFEIEGEEGFRKREAQVIADLSCASGQIVATGGGVVLRPENRVDMTSSGYVVYLNVPPHTLWERTRHDKNRPLLQVEDPLLKLKELYAERDPYYREVANLIIDSGRMSPYALLQLITKEVEERWKH